jgi:uncharacterized protein YuzE
MREVHVPLRVSHDEAVNAAYVYLKSDIAHGEAATTHTVETGVGGASINLDFDREGRILGVEVLECDKTLHPELLQSVLAAPSTDVGGRRRPSR